MQGGGKGQAWPLQHGAVWAFPPLCPARAGWAVLQTEGRIGGRGWRDGPSASHDTQGEIRHQESRRVEGKQGVDMDRAGALAAPNLQFLTGRWAGASSWGEGLR